MRWGADESRPPSFVTIIIMQLAKTFGPLDKLDPDIDRAAKELRVPVVGPNGEFKVARVGPGHENVGGDRPVVFSAEIGRPEIPERYIRKGWVKYQDLCADAPQYWAKWKATDDAARKGATLRDLPADFYHPEVYRRRAEVDRGRPILDVATLIAPPKQQAKKD